MRATEGGGLRRRSGRLPPAARSAVAFRGAASRGGSGRSRTARAAPPRHGPVVDPSRNQAMPVPRGGGPPPRGCRGARGSGAAPPGAARATRNPARTFPWIEVASFFPPRGLAGLPPRLRPLGSRRPHAGPIGGDDHIDGRTPRASRAPRARRAGPSPGFLRMESESPAVSRRASGWFGARSDYAFRRFRSMPRPSRPMRATDGSGTAFHELFLYESAVNDPVFVGLSGAEKASDVTLSETM